MNGGAGQRRPLPAAPATTLEVLIAELIHELRGLREDMKLTPGTPIEGTLELREPTKRRRS